MRAVVTLSLAFAVVLFLRGAWRLRGCKRPGIGAGRLVAAAVGFAALTLALSDDLDAAGHALFVVHMAQHLLLISVAAPALLLADPFAVTLWGLPLRARRVFCRALTPGRALRRIVAQITRMTLTWPVYVLILWLWHLPGPYDAASVHARLQQSLGKLRAEVAAAITRKKVPELTFRVLAFDASLQPR